MWAGGSTEDPGGPSKNPETPALKEELKDLKEQSDQQQVLIAQLKEMLRKTEHTSVSQEKVVEYANTLTKMNARAKKSQFKDNKDESRSTQVKGETQASEKINLLREQLKQNKIKLAERGKSQKGIEDMVIQIKAQLDDSQHLLNQTPLNISLFEDRVDYSANTSSQDLYNILLNKDKFINDLNGKITKLEGTILDLQENVKEKDCVIDARTKAITLMSENLSKKGKTTLDALDETKEEMRNMQENFIKMEEEMKIDNQNLLLQLEQKNSIIDNLRAENESLINSEDSLKKELDVLQSNHSQKIKELEEVISNLDTASTNLQNTSRESPARSSKRGKKGKQQKQEENLQIIDTKKIEELENTILLLKTKIEENETLINSKQEIINEVENKFKEAKENYENKITQLETSLSSLNTQIENKPKEVPLESNELIKLKQQLDESNKSMIKVKAFHKSKIKELNKKIDTFKKMGDVNAEVVRLDSENSKLSQKIAELEEEKGQLQLNMIDSKESINLDEVNELRGKLKDYEETIGSHEKSIADLNGEIVKKEEHLLVLTKKLEDLNSSISAQVKSDLSSVQFEEEFENLQSENRAISEQKREIEKSYAVLKEELELTKKEKGEINSKLESLAQENMELNDRLEKLSAEKVSSAESIEFVENLTQQEKMELEGYQRNLALKSIENTDEYPELNNTVKQITEETSELVHKIEMYNVERREVMDKMETLTVENNQLNLKVKEIENNRDVLVETYELLQTEKEELNNTLKEMEERNAEIEENRDNLIEYKSLIDIQKQEIQELKVQLMSAKDFEEKSNEKLIALESANIELKLKLEKGDFDENKLKECLEEIDFYKNTINENKDELIKSSNLINDLQNKIDDNNNIIKNYQNEVETLNSIILELEEKGKPEENMNLMSDELEVIKSSLQEYQEQIDIYEKELIENKNVINKLNVDLKHLNVTLVNTQDLLNSKDQEILVCNQKLEEMNNKNQQLQEKDAKYQHICEELKQKYLNLQKQLENNSGSFEPLKEKVNELENKNKDQLQKMKKLAANLKKRNNEYKDLETNYTEVLEKWENEVKEKDEFKNKVIEAENKLSGSDHEMNKLKTDIEELKAVYEKELTKLKVDYEKLKENNYNLEQNNVELTINVSNFTSRSEDYQNIIREYEHQISNLSNELELLQSNANNTSNIELNERDEIISNLNEQIEKLRINNLNERKELETKIKDFEVSIENKNDELTKCNDDLRRLQEAIKILEKNHDIPFNSEIDLESRVQALLDLDEQTKASLDSLRSENSILMEKLESTTNEKDTSNNQLATALEKNKTSKLEIHELLNERFILITEQEKLNTTIKTLLQERDQWSKTSQDDIDQYCIERDDLLNQFDASKKECGKLGEKLEESYKIINNLKEEINRQKIDFDENYKGYQTIDYEHKMSLNLIEELNNKVTELQTALSQNSHELENYFKLLQVNDEVDLERIIGELKLIIAEKQKSLQQTTSSAADFFNNFTNESNNSDLIKEIDCLNIILQQHISRYGEIITFNNKIKELEESKLNIEDTIVPKNISQAASEPSDNSDEELKNKIKTLEFMLHNSEQEKENALLQCENFSSELARFLYNKEKSYMSEIESQIIDGEEVTISPKMRKLMMQDLHIPDDSQPIDQNPCVSKKTYQCFPEEKNAFNENDDGWGFGCEDVKLEAEHVQQSTSFFNQDLSERIKVMELEREKHLEEIKQGQIKCGKLIKKFKEMKVKNEQLLSKKSGEAFNDLNDAIVDELKQQIAILEKRIKENTVEFEKEKIEKQNILKRIDVLTAANERMIEMKEKQDIEIIGYQQSIRELNLKLEQFAWGDDKNDNNKQSNKSESINEPSLDLANKVDELTKIVNELTLDNEELQLLLEEQHSLRIEAEKAKNNLVLNENMQSDYNKIVEDNLELSKNLLLTEEKMKELSQKLHNNYSEKTQLEATVLDNNLTIEALKRELQEINTSFEDLMNKNDFDNSIELKQKLDSCESEKWNLNATIQELSRENNEIKQNLQYISTDLGAKVTELLSDVNKLTIEIEGKDENINRLHEIVSNKNEELIELEKLITETNSELNKNDLQIKDLIKNLSELELQMKDKESQIKENELQLLEKDSKINKFYSQIQEKYSEVNKKDDELKEKDSVIIEKNLLIEEKETKVNELMAKVTESDRDFNERISSTVADLEQKWIVLVDERGNDVATSWSNHLEMREREFSLLQEELNTKLYDLQGKYNILVNENEGLKNNLDSELSNTISTISTLQQEIIDYQRRIKELTTIVDEKQILIETIEARNLEYLNEVNNLKKSYDELNLNLITLGETLNLKETECYNLQENLNLVTRDHNYCSINNQELLNQIKNYGEKLIEQENQTINIRELNQENENLKDLNEKLQQNQINLNETLQQLTSHNDELKQNVAILNGAMKQVTDENNNLRETESILNDSIKQLMTQNNELNGSLISLDELKSQKETFNNQIIHLNQLLNSKNNEIEEIKARFNESISSYNQDLQQQLFDKQQEITNYSLQLQETNIQIVNLTEELENYKYIADQAQHKDMEINRLNNLIHEKEQEYSYNLQSKTLESEAVVFENTQQIDSLKRKLQETENHYEEILLSKETEIEAYKDEFKDLVNKSALDQSNLELAEKNNKLLEAETILEEDENQLIELKNIIEEQVLKIEELQKELLEKSGNYDALIAELGGPQELRSQVQKVEGENLVEPFSQAELDLALYMLHQRDVRCEELTIELMQLLEERDTLQLKLSNALREKEELKSKNEPSQNEIKKEVTFAPSPGAIPKSTAIILGATGTELAAEATEDEKLEDKLSELKIVGYKKDKSLLDDQELRRLTILQQHKDEISKLPPEAAARLVDASYTLSRDVQSPSKVLLNWLWGKSTPKVNNI